MFAYDYLHTAPRHKFVLSFTMISITKVVIRPVTINMQLLKIIPKGFDWFKFDSNVVTKK